LIPRVRVPDSAQVGLGQILLAQSDIDHGIAELEEAFRLNPNDPSILSVYRGWNYVVGRAQEGVELINRASRLSPNTPDAYYAYVDPFYATGRYEETVARVKITAFAPWNQMLLAGSYARLGRQADAAAVLAELSRLYPDPSMERLFSDFGGIKDPDPRALHGGCAQGRAKRVRHRGGVAETSEDDAPRPLRRPPRCETSYAK
jgi:tetratricopeptide (TPR) repeat protein